MDTEINKRPGIVKRLEKAFGAIDKEWDKNAPETSTPVPPSVKTPTTRSTPLGRRLKQSDFGSSRMSLFSSHQGSPKPRTPSPVPTPPPLQRMRTAVIIKQADVVESEEEKKKKAEEVAREEERIALDKKKAALQSAKLGVDMPPQQSIRLSSQEEISQPASEEKDLPLTVDIQATETQKEVVLQEGESLAEMRKRQQIIYNDIKAELEFKSLVRVQKLIRGRFARNKFLKLKEDHALGTAARLIQLVWRFRKRRAKRKWEETMAAIKVQAVIRGRMARRFKTLMTPRSRWKQPHLLLERASAGYVAMKTHSVITRLKWDRMHDSPTECLQVLQEVVEEAKKSRNRLDVKNTVGALSILALRSAMKGVSTAGVDIMTNSGGARCLVKYLEEYPKDKDVLRYIILAISYWGLHNDSIRDYFRRKGCYDKFYDILREENDDERMRVTALFGVISSMSSEDLSTSARMFNAEEIMIDPEVYHRLKLFCVSDYQNLLRVVKELRGGYPTREETNRAKEKERQTIMSIVGTVETKLGTKWKGVYRDIKSGTFEKKIYGKAEAATKKLKIRESTLHLAEEGMKRAQSLEKSKKMTFSETVQRMLKQKMMEDEISELHEEVGGLLSDVHQAISTTDSPSGAKNFMDWSLFEASSISQWGHLDSTKSAFNKPGGIQTRFKLPGTKNHFAGVAAASPRKQSSSYQVPH